MIQNRKHNACATRSSLPADRSHTETCVVVSRLHDTVVRFRTAVNSRQGTTTEVNSRRGDLRRHDILWWYHVNKFRAMRGNRSELAPARKSPWCHVNTPLLDPEMTLFRSEGLLVREGSCSLVP